MDGLTRRAWLQSAGSGLLLPFLPSLARAETAASPPRLLYWFAPNGVVADSFVPATEGPLTTLPPTLASLVRVQDDVSVLGGIDNPSCFNIFAGRRPHDCGTASWLTDVTFDPDTPGLHNGISADQVAAAAIGTATPFASLQLGNPGIGLACDDYTCVYQRNISWASSAGPLPPLEDLRVAFDRMFAGTDSALSDEAAAQRRALQKSVLDLVSERTAAVSRQLSTADRSTLDDFLTGVRELERRIDLTTGECSDAPIDLDATSLEAHGRAMADLMVLALSCDQTRVISFMHGPGSAYHDYSFLGVVGLHHAISHHANAELTMGPVRRVDAWVMQQFTYLVERLAETIEPDGSRLLDHTLALYGSGISNGNDHSFTELPLVLAGGQALGVRQGLHRRYDSAPMADLHLGLLERMGIRRASFGQHGTTPLDLS